jgi:uncharacterized protein YkwD
MLAGMKKIRILISFVIVVTSFLALTPSGQAEEVIGTPVSIPDQPNQPRLQYTGCGGKTVPAAREAYEQRVVEMANQERISRGLPPLKRSDNLTAAARYHAADMVQDNYFGHDTLDRVGGELHFVCGPWDRIASYYSGARGENAAAGYTTPEAAMQAWMNSDGHRSNILNPSSWEIGVGFYEGGGDFNYYWVQDFGFQSGYYPLIINNEDRSTDKRNVTLYIYGEWQEMRLRNDEKSWTEWEPFQSQVNWTLGAGSGEHTVHVELRSGNQASASSDSIYLTSDDPVLGNLPENLVFLYSIPDQRMYPAYLDITPLNIGNNVPLNWKVTQERTFFNANPGTGTTPTAIHVTPATFNQKIPATYLGELTITITDPNGVDNSPHTSQVTLIVSDSKIHQVFIPGIQR